jgi:hypothetical protein
MNKYNIKNDGKNLSKDCLICKDIGDISIFSGLIGAIYSSLAPVPT